MLRKNDKTITGRTVATLAIGLYFSNTTKSQAKKMRGWMIKMRGTVIEKIEDLEEVTEPVYRAVLDKVANSEISVSKIPRSEILMLATDIKREWKSINKLRKSEESKPRRKKR